MTTLVETPTGGLQQIEPPSNFQFLHMIGNPSPNPTTASRARLQWFNRIERQENAALEFFTWENTSTDGFQLLAKKKILVMGCYNAGGNVAGDRAAVMSTRDVINDGAGGALPPGSSGTIETRANSMDQAGVGDTLITSMTEGNALTNGANHIRAWGESNSNPKHVPFFFPMDIGEYLWCHRPGSTQVGEWSTGSFNTDFYITAMRIK